MVDEARALSHRRPRPSCSYQVPPTDSAVSVDSDDNLFRIISLRRKLNLHPWSAPRSPTNSINNVNVSSNQLCETESTSLEEIEQREKEKETVESEEEAEVEVEVVTEELVEEEDYTPSYSPVLDDEMLILNNILHNLSISERQLQPQPFPAPSRWVPSLATILEEEVITIHLE
ncbi:jg1388 [Pararge aegeria aegeria]|uniref:Jg1388 protein n=1 Tax=Pararge aegeria aegeria TaxID=348720 RepID=A0A8S4QR72_9NEOP|nr:jg1388 [Pararge aegeria aegeria]